MSAEQAGAQARQLVMVHWGGIANDGFGRFYGEPFKAESAGMRVVQDSTGPSAGRVRSMVETGRVTRDRCDSTASSSVVLGKQNLISRVDCSIVNRENVIGPGFALEFGAAPYSFSSVLAHDSSKFPHGGPQNGADFFDLRRFPGRRLLRRDALAPLDAVGRALGKDPRARYPLGVRACLARIREVRRNAVFWNSGSESEQFLRTCSASRASAEPGRSWTPCLRESDIIVCLPPATEETRGILA